MSTYSLVLMDFLVVAFKFSHIMGYYCKAVDIIKRNVNLLSPLDRL